MRDESDQAKLGMVDVFDDLAHTAVCLKTGTEWQRVQITDADLERLLPGDGISGEGASSIGSALSEEELTVLREAGSSVPVIQYLQDLLRRAVQLGASDIHLRAGARVASAQLRIDGELEEVNSPSLDQLSEVVSRLKLLAHLDISERRVPQDGRLRVTIAGRQTDFRLSTMPHLNGEGAVLRVLNKDTTALNIAELGLEPEVVAHLRSVAQLSGGLFLVVGPTGSGKTTTLYALLNEILRPDINVVTIEDPVEYRLEGAAQIQIDEKAGLSFPRALRSVLRQDPDVVLVGEIRDGETAQIAVQAALTGHLVLASLHAETARKSVPRLLDMGVEPYLLTTVLRGALGQRLIRKNCDCATFGTPEVACPECQGTGYVGRRAHGEFVEFNGEVDQGEKPSSVLKQFPGRTRIEDADDQR
jgi:type II secretory ATPase GspE/PulE/Tfp pilus assembly ATPase PilB-like protein